MRRPKTQTLRLCNHRTKRCELANWSGSTIDVYCLQWKFAHFPGNLYPGTIVALMQTTYEQEAEGMRRPKTQTLRLCNHRTKRCELANWSGSTIAVYCLQWKFAHFPGNLYPATIVALMQTTYEQEAEGMRRPKTQTLRLYNQRTKRCEVANLSTTTFDV